jgi:hypothetical protein
VTTWSGKDVAMFWEGAGGPASRAVEWVAISIGESDLDDQAVSPAGAIGLWQIMPFNAAPYGYQVSDLYNPNVNADVAVQMSGGGTNCAAWDSCYLDIEASGRYEYLAWPQVGSADYNNLPIAAAMLGGKYTLSIAAPSYPGVDDSLPGTVAQLNLMSSKSVPALGLRAARAGRAAAALYR